MKVCLDPYPLRAPMCLGLLLVMLAGPGCSADAPEESTLAAAEASATTAADDQAIRPFTIRVPDAVLADLKERLTRSRFPDEIEGAGWTYGTNLAYLKELVAYWRDRFDWREQERRLNQFEQFVTNIEGIDVHFIHRRARQPNAFPLMITHGWPGSVVEFAKIIGPLTDPVAHGGSSEDAFDVVIPSIPGFGFSGKPRNPGYNPERMAGILAKLMARLGYTRYGLQGGDWGAIIGSAQAIVDADHVAGLHINMCTANPPAGVANPEGMLSPAELGRWKARQAFTAEETGYSQVQGTKAQTIGTALNDSPVGLAAWIVEKFNTWCDCDGNPEKRFTKDELLTNITVYWVTQTAASSARLYYESRHTAGSLRGQRVEVPTACAAFAKEPFWSPRPWVQARYNLKRWTELPSGGHFAALEEPELLVNDVRAFFREVRLAPAASQ